MGRTICSLSGRKLCCFVLLLRRFSFISLSTSGRVRVFKKKVRCFFNPRIVFDVTCRENLFFLGTSFSHTLVTDSFCVFWHTDLTKADPFYTAASIFLGGEGDKYMGMPQFFCSITTSKLHLLVSGTVKWQSAIRRRTPRDSILTREAGLDCRFPVTKWEWGPDSRPRQTPLADNIFSHLVMYSSSSSLFLEIAQRSANIPLLAKLVKVGSKNICSYCCGWYQ